MKKELFTSEILTITRKRVVKYVLKNSGTIEDANDILQEGFTAYIINIRKPDFKLTTNPENYIFCICRNLWLSQIRIKRQKRTFSEEFENFPCEESNLILIKERKDALINIMDNNIKRLSQKCQEIFRFRKEGLSCEQIAVKMNWKKGSISKDKFYRCKKRLLQVIAEDPEYITFNNIEVEIDERRG